MSFKGPMQRKPYPSRCSVCGSQITEQRVTLSFPDGKGVTDW
jgi:hypothetical protein